MKTYIGKVNVFEGIITIRPIFDDETVLLEDGDEFISITTVVDLEKYRK